MSASVFPTSKSRAPASQPVCSTGRNVIWYVVRRCAERMQLDHLAPHDLRRTCAKLCHVNGEELEQIQFLIGHVSVLRTERYLGCKQNLEEPVNDRFGPLLVPTRDRQERSRHTERCGAFQTMLAVVHQIQVRGIIVSLAP